MKTLSFLAAMLHAASPSCRRRLAIGCAALAALLAPVLSADDLNVNENLYIYGDLNMGGLGVFYGTAGINFGSWDEGNSEWHVTSGDNYSGLYDGDDATFNSLTVGTLTYGGLILGGNIVYNDLAVGTFDTGSGTVSGAEIGFDVNETRISFLSPGETARFAWKQNTAAAAATQMVLNSHGNLTLNDSTTGNSITINPSNYTIVLAGASSRVISLISVYNATFSLGNGAISANPNGTDLTIANVTMTGNIASGALAFTNPGYSSNIVIDAVAQNISFSNGFSLGSNATQVKLLFGGSGVALGLNATASGNASFAVGNATTASGSFAIALGNNSIASGDYSMAWGGGNASATGAVAFGSSTTVSGNYAIALGLGLNITTNNTVAVGHYNTVIPPNPGDTSLEPAFIVGIGNSTARNNGLEILNNGNATVNGPVTAPTLQVAGTLTLNGKATFNGTVTFSQALGDIPMGNFTH